MVENKPSWFKYLHKLNGSNWRKRLGNFYCKVDLRKLSEENRKEIGDYFPYYNVRNAIFLELRESKEYRELSNKIRARKQIKAHYNRIYLGFKKELNDDIELMDKLYHEINIIYYSSMVQFNKKVIKIYKKALLDLIRKRFEEENP